jgi:hypothetical protein
MRSFSLTNTLLTFTFAVLTVHCGRKGDPIPHPRAAAQAAVVQMASLRVLSVTLPTRDVQDQPLVGVEQIRVLYLPLGLTKPTPDEVFSRGEIVLDRRRPDLPGPGDTLTLNLRSLQRPAGWIVVVAVRVGNVPGRPSVVLPWMDPAI